MKYEKSLEDEIDWKVIDQLHTATNFFASTSTELKKIFFTLIVIAIPTLIKLSGDKLDRALFISIFVLTFLFWILDSYTYFYQDKLREKMNLLFNDIKNRNKTENMPDSNEEEVTIEIDRTSENRLKRSLFNYSMFLYLLVFIINLLATILFYNELI
ncbi:hypothetical protein LPB85_17115 [Chryseobacterium sp. LC2016-27]|uniref:hypothetical protein n=1 Tax=Chryseobacterium sp. LC2016-27 TaxID=2897326 RepID=UPI001E3E7994|nr:hypothetical protein [Chryseobacterium sp. LC2016-27]MCD0457174.1 hypothetical protein [Chryseobacterium sp. LC2016-27]